MSKEDKHFSQTRHSDIEEDGNDDNKYIVFALASELYAVKLLDVREVVEPQPIKKIPNTVSCFKGVCNLRGQIVGIIDLRTRFDLEKTESNQGILCVFETETGAIAAVVDHIVTVCSIPIEDIEEKPNIISTIPINCIVGIGKFEDRLVTLINLKEILSKEEIAKVENSKKLVNNS